MEVRELKVSDGVVLQKIRLQALSDSPEAFGSSYEEECVWEKSVYENRIRSGGSFYFGAFTDENMVGMICLSINQRLKTKHRAMIQSFYVNAAYRGRGIGKKLIQSAIDKASSLRMIEQIELSVVTEQLAAVSLYRTMGFEIYGEEYHSLKINDRYYNEFYMMKKLETKKYRYEREVGMKGFTRKEPLFSLCGLKCGLCTMHIGGYCPGCGGGDGNQSCPIAKCSLQRGGIQFCYECEEYPCEKYDGRDEFDSFIPCRGRQKDFDRAKELGLPAYMEDLNEKIQILSYLLENFNDGRKKTFFDTAVYLLETEELRKIVDGLQSREGLMEQPVKERAAIASKMLQEWADQNGISLKLVKKPKVKK